LIRRKARRQGRVCDAIRHVWWAFETKSNARIMRLQHGHQCASNMITRKNNTYYSRRSAECKGIAGNKNQSGTKLRTRYSSVNF
jgi:hypothetical protein